METVTAHIPWTVMRTEQAEAGETLRNLEVTYPRQWAWVNPGGGGQGKRKCFLLLFPKSVYFLVLKPIKKRNRVENITLVIGHAYSFKEKGPRVRELHGSHRQSFLRGSKVALLKMEIQSFPNEITEEQMS